MTGSFLATASVLTSYQIVLVTLIASIVLLCVRAWLGARGIVIIRRVSVLLNAAIIFFAFLFLLTVILRFKTLA